MVNCGLFFLISGLIRVFRYSSLFLNIILALETLDIILLDFIPEGLLALFRYYSFDTVSGPLIQ